MTMQSILASLDVFLVLLNCLGPSNPLSSECPDISRTTNVTSGDEVEEEEQKAVSPPPFAMGTAPLPSLLGIADES